MNTHKNSGISQSVFVIRVLVWRHTQVHSKFSLALRRAPNHITINPIILLYQFSVIPVTPVPVIRDPSHSEHLPEYHPMVWYPPDIDASKYRLHILSDTPGGFYRLEYILMIKDKSTTSFCYNRLYAISNRYHCSRQIHPLYTEFRHLADTSSSQLSIVLPADQEYLRVVAVQTAQIL